MFRAVISRLFRGRHYWRSVSFDEIAELYTSRLITVFAINIINLFAAVYLYKLGYSLTFIAAFYGLFYLLIRIPASWLAAQFVAYFGPKHGVLAANLLRLPSLMAFALVPMLSGHEAVLAIGIFGFFQQVSAAFYDIAYTVDFSKVKHPLHAGKEIGTMQQIEKIARVGSPVLGGLIASLWSPDITIMIACLLFAVAAVPLFRSVEPIEVRSRLRLNGFPWRFAARSLVAQTVTGFDFVASGLAWTLFVTITVFGGVGNDVYVALGGLASLGVLVSMVAAWAFGRLTDRHHGDVLLAGGTVTNAVIHVARPFVTTTNGVLLTSVANETATSAYTLPFTRVMFDVADSSGHRIAYMMCAEMTLNVGAALGCLVLYLCVTWFGAHTGMMVTFFVAAAYETLMLIAARAAR